MAMFVFSLLKQIHLSKLRLSALLLTLCQLATTLPINGTEGLLLPGMVGATRPSCAEIQNYPKWYQPSQKFDQGDCDQALKLFFNDYVKRHNGQRYEFFNAQHHPIHEIPTQRVPLKFAHGTCVVAIAMRNQFDWGSLPHEIPFRSAPSDISSFQKLYQGVREINKECVEANGEPGWYQTGDLNSIAVFIWQAASEINHHIQASVGGFITHSSLVDTA